MSGLRLAIAQVNPIMGDLHYNKKLILQTLEDAVKQGCDVVVFPEMVLTGYPPEDLLLRPGFLEDVEEVLDDIRKHVHQTMVIVGTPQRSNEQLYNAAVVFYEQANLIQHYKIELPNYGVFDEKRYFSKGPEPLVLSMEGVSFALTVCEDIWVSNGSCEQVIKNSKLPLVINMAASPYHAGKLSERQQIIQQFAMKSGAMVAYANLLGGQDELVFDGGSMVVSAEGEVVATAPHFKPDLLMYDFPETLENQYGVVDEQTATVKLFNRETTVKKPLSTVQHVMKQGVEEIHYALTLGIHDYVRKNGFEKVVIGLSGGIDSAVTAALAVEALGAENVEGVTMPSNYSSDATKSDALLLAENLGITCATIPIEQVLESYSQQLYPDFISGEPGIEYENLQARIRGNYLMALSNRYGWLVLTTGNKSETAVGYCTLYGDMAGGFAVIKDVYKSTVYQLARFINASIGKEWIPESTITRPPSAELRPDQKDEDSLPPYDVLDPILQAYIEEDRAPEDIIQYGYDQQTVLDIIRLVDRNEYKRRQAPPGIKITPKAFGRDRRLPITNRYSSHLMKRFK